MPTTTQVTYNIPTGATLGSTNSSTGSDPGAFTGGLTLQVTYDDNGKVSKVEVVNSSLKVDAPNDKYDNTFDDVSGISKGTTITNTSDHDGYAVTWNNSTNTINLTFQSSVDSTANISNDYNQLAISFKDPALFTNSVTDGVGRTVDLNVSEHYFSVDAKGQTYSTSLANKELIQDAQESNEHVVCYTKGTLIETAKGQVAVEDLQLGDLIKTVSGEAMPLVWLGHRTINCTTQKDQDKAYPVRIKQGAFGQGLPARDLSVSPHHSLYVDGVMIPAIHLVNGQTITQERTETLVTYYHVELPSHQAIYAEGLPAESYLDTSPENRHFFMDGNGTAKVFEINPQFPPCPENTPVWQHTWDTQGYAKLTQSGPVLEAVKARLQARAQDLAALEQVAA